MDNGVIYDLLIIGAGPAGYTGAIYAAKKGMKVALIERDRLGGTCLNRGCIPTKVYCASAELILKMRESSRFSVKGVSEDVSIDFASLFERKETIVNKQVEGIRQLLKGNRIDLYEGDAFIESENRVVIKKNGSDEIDTINFKNLLIATGSEPAGVRGLEIDHKNILDSTDMLSLRELPSSLLIVGGGVIGVEFAMIMSLFGVKVYLVEVLKRIIATEDIMASRIVATRLKSLGVDINTDVLIEDVRIGDSGIDVRLKNQKSFKVDRILVAAGRRPIINASQSIVSQILGERGFVVVDESLRTKLNNVFAAGDVIGGMMLAHKAHYDAEVAIDNISGKVKKVDYSAVPAVIYTYPEVASVGISEERAKEKGIEIKVGRFFLASNGMAMAKNATEGFVKIIADRINGRIIGGTIVSESASEMVSTLTLAIKEGMRFENIHHLIWPHPTISESIGEAMRDIEGMAIHKIGL